MRGLLQAKRNDDGDERAAFRPARAHALYRALFGEVEDLITGKHLLIVPSGALTQLPFQVLVTAPPNAAAPGGRRISRTAWLGARHPSRCCRPCLRSRRCARMSGQPAPRKAYDRLRQPSARRARCALRGARQEGAREQERCPVARTSAATLGRARRRGARRDRGAGSPMSPISGRRRRCPRPPTSCAPWRTT